MKKWPLLLVLFLPSILSGKETDGIVDSVRTVLPASRDVAEILRGANSGIEVRGVTGSPWELSSINIHGMSDIHANSQPLFVIDGAFVGDAVSCQSDPFWHRPGATQVTPVNPIPHLSVYDISNIEVLKSASATARYGNLGANGVVIISTTPSVNEKQRVYVNSDFGVSFTSYSNLRPAFDQNHSVRFKGSSAASTYSISANFRGLGGVVPNTSSNVLDINASFNTRANKYIHVGANALIGIGNIKQTTGAAAFGQGSTLLAIRGILVNDETLESWIDSYDETCRSYNMNASAYVKVNILKSLSLNVRGGAGFRQLVRSIWYGNDTAYGSQTNGASSQLNERDLSGNINASLNYKGYLSDKNSLSASLQYETFIDGFSLNILEGHYFFSSELKENGINLSEGERIPRLLNYNYLTRGIIGAATYDYDEMVGVDMCVRADNAPKYDDFKFIIHPSASAFFDISKLIDVPSINSLKVDLGWGMSGRYKVLPCLSVLPEEIPYYNYLAGVESSEFDAGISLSLFGGRHRMHLGWYDKTADDNLNLFSFGTRGTNYLYYSDRTSVSSSNVKTRNTGFEFDWQSMIVNSKDWKVSAGANVTYNANNVISRDYSSTFEQSSGITGAVVIPGYSAWSIIGYELTEDGLYKDVNGDGHITTSDCKVLGRTIPLCYGGLFVRASFRNISLVANADWAAGFDIVNLNKMAEEGRNKITSRYIYDGSFLRLGTLSLSYSLPLKSNAIKAVNFAVTGKNLLTLSQYSSDNPDIRWNDYGTYPMIKSVIFSLGLTF